MLDTLPPPSPLLFWGFVALPVLVAGAVIAAVWHGQGRRGGLVALSVATLWMGGTAGLAQAGVLDVWTPPRIFLVIGPMLAGLAWASRQRWTERLGDLPLSLLVGFQSFRVLVEGLLHLAVLEGVAHPTMTWSGTNWDIVPGVTALLLAPFAPRLKPQTLQTWNLLSAAVLVVTVMSGILASPSPVRQIMGDPANGFVAAFPFVWLPAVLVCSAWLGHIVLFRRLRRVRSSESR